MIYMPAEDAKTMRLYWDSRVVVSFAMREVDVQISMTQVLGGIRWRLRDLHALGSFLVDFKGSQKHRVSASLHRSQLEATGGQTSGYLELSRLSIYGLLLLKRHELVLYWYMYVYIRVYCMLQAIYAVVYNFERMLIML